MGILSYLLSCQDPRLAVWLYTLLSRLKSLNEKFICPGWELTAKIGFLRLCWLLGFCLLLGMTRGSHFSIFPFCSWPFVTQWSPSLGKQGLDCAVHMDLVGIRFCFPSLLFLVFFENIKQLALRFSLLLPYSCSPNPPSTMANSARGSRVKFQPCQLLCVALDNYLTFPSSSVVQAW